MAFTRRESYRDMPKTRPNYLRVFLTFARNCWVRDMTFRANFLINVVTVAAWFVVIVTFFNILFMHTGMIGQGWTRYAFFAFMATNMIVNGLIETFFFTNATEFSEHIRKGTLDFVLLKPIDTQFLVSLEKIDWSNLSSVALGLGLLVYGVAHLAEPPRVFDVLLYITFVGVGVVIYYSLLVILASLSVWMGRNQGIENFWFYLTVFARYPRNIYQGGWGNALRGVFTYVVPVLVVINVPAEVVVRMLNPSLATFAVVAAGGFLLLSRAVLGLALRNYRSASS